eukprot:13364992-Heterocapsa_arctica.AAC.1
MGRKVRVGEGQADQKSVVVDFLKRVALHAAHVPAISLELKVESQLITVPGDASQVLKSGL